MGPLWQFMQPTDLKSAKPSFSELEMAFTSPLIYWSNRELLATRVLSKAAMALPIAILSIGAFSPKAFAKMVRYSGISRTQIGRASCRDRVWAWVIVGVLSSK